MLTDADKHRVVFALGLPGRILDVRSMDYSSVISNKLVDLNQFIEEKVLELLSDIDDIKAKLKASPNKANVKQIGDIQLDTQISLNVINKELSRLCDELAKLLEIPNRSKAGRNYVNVLL